MSAAPATTSAPAGPALRIGDRSIPVVLPRLGDPRLRLAAVLLTVQVLGQTLLDFKLSIAQILVSIGVAAAIELTVTYRRLQMIVWPASAMLTGNSIALLLRATGTEHGDWWSLNGIHYFILAVVLSLLSKYLLRPGGRHIFNPSNVGLVWTLLVIGPSGVFPQYLWWGPLGVPVLLAEAVILAGGFWVLRKVRMIPMALSFLAPFAVLVGVLAVNGQEFFAIWHVGPVDGFFYWVNVVASPEVLIFVFFMMSDPQTAPKSPVGRLLYGSSTALLAVALIAFQPTEFGVKLGILASLTVTCALVPFFERAAARLAVDPQIPDDGGAVAAAAPPPVMQRVRAAARRPVVLAVVIITMTALVDTARLSGNDRLLLIEQGLSGQRNPQ